MALIILVCMVSIYFIFDYNGNPPKYTAQDSENLIDNCYNANQTNLECYHICREEGWNEEWCQEKNGEQNEKR